MKLTLDTDARQLIQEDGGKTTRLDLYSKEAFEVLSKPYLAMGWNLKYAYTFTWLGRPVIQLPDDMIRTQEVIASLKPDVIIETGVAHGGSLIFYASLAKLLGKGRVIGIDIEIRPHNRKAIEAHFLSPLITLIEGDSADAATVNKVRSLVKPGETVLILLDSCHTRKHVAAELEAYHNMVTPGSYIVATDGIMQDLADVPRGQKGWDTDNPVEAVKDFLATHPQFVLDRPAWSFNESTLTKELTYWPSAWLRRK